MISPRLPPWKEVARGARSDPARPYLPAQEPPHDKHNHDDAEDAAETGASVPAVSIISPASAEDEDQDYDKENCAHISACGQVRVVWSDGLYGFFAASRTASLRPPTAF
jgi:hypothetical protein